MSFVLPPRQESLPPVMQVRYGLRPFSRDRVTVRGSLTISLSAVGRLLSPFLRLGGAFAPRGGRDVPVTVRLSTGPGTDILHFDRFFHYPGGRTFRFHSRLLPGRGSEVRELIRFGLGWRSHCVVQGSRMDLRHAGYFLRLGRKTYPLPLEWLIGRCTAVEEALDKERYRMWMQVRHPLLGMLQSYTGLFRVTEVVHA